MAFWGKATLFFSDGAYGWSETYYLEVTTFDNLLAQAVKLAKKRAVLMGTGPRLTYARVSDDAIDRDSQLQALNYGTNAGDPYAVAIPLANPSPSDVPYSAILVRGESGTLYRKSIYLRGCPDDQIVDPAGPSIPAEWGKAFNAWALLLTQGWAFKIYNRDPLVAPLKPIIGMAFAPTGDLVTITSNNHGFVDGDQVHIFKAKGKQVPVGYFTVREATLNTFRIDWAFTYLQAVWNYGGVIQKRIRGYALFSRVFVRGETHRKTGRPFGSPVGRLSTRR